MAQTTTTDRPSQNPVSPTTDVAAGRGPLQHPTLTVDRSTAATIAALPSASDQRSSLAPLSDVQRREGAAAVAALREDQRRNIEPLQLQALTDLAARSAPQNRQQLLNDVTALLRTPGPSGQPLLTATEQRELLERLARMPGSNQEEVLTRQRALVRQVERTLEGLTPDQQRTVMQLLAKIPAESTQQVRFLDDLKTALDRVPNQRNELLAQFQRLATTVEFSAGTGSQLSVLNAEQLDRVRDGRSVRGTALIDLAHDLAQDIQQGRTNRCPGGSAATMCAVENPVLYARLASSLLIEGTATTPGGVVITRQAGTSERFFNGGAPMGRGEEARFHTSLTGHAMQCAIMQRACGRIDISDGAFAHYSDRHETGALGYVAVTASLLGYSPRVMVNGDPGIREAVLESGAQVQVKWSPPGQQHANHVIYVFAQNAPAHVTGPLLDADGRAMARGDAVLISNSQGPNEPVPFPGAQQVFRINPETGRPEATQRWLIPRAVFDSQVTIDVANISTRIPARPGEPWAPDAALAARMERAQVVGSEALHEQYRTNPEMPRYWAVPRSEETLIARAPTSQVAATREEPVATPITRPTLVTAPSPETTPERPVVSGAVAQAPRTKGKNPFEPDEMGPVATADPTPKQEERRLSPFARVLYGPKDMA
jgi:hypothetical protein